MPIQPGRNEIPCYGARADSEAQAELDVQPMQVLEARSIGCQRYDWLIGKVLADARVDGRMRRRAVVFHILGVVKERGEVKISAPELSEAFKVEREFD